MYLLFIIAAANKWTVSFRSVSMNYPTNSISWLNVPCIFIDVPVTSRNNCCACVRTLNAFSSWPHVFSKPTRHRSRFQLSRIFFFSSFLAHFVVDKTNLEQFIDVITWYVSNYNYNLFLLTGGFPRMPLTIFARFGRTQIVFFFVKFKTKSFFNFFFVAVFLFCSATFHVFDAGKKKITLGKFRKIQ